MAVSHQPDIASRLRAARERAGWSKEALAFHSGLSWSAIASLEAGRRKNTRPHTLSVLSEALGVTIEYLVGGSPSLPTMLGHWALLYDTDEDFAAAAGAFLNQGLERFEALLVATGRTNLDLLRDLLGPNASEVVFVDAMQWYDSPRAALKSYRAFITERMDAGAAWVRILAEPPWAGRSERETRLLSRCEWIFNLAFGTLPVTVLCPYDKRSVEPALVEEARLTHPQSVAGGVVASNPSYSDPEEFFLNRQEDSET